MSKKKFIGVIIILVLALIALGGSYYYFVNEDEKTTLTLSEKRWIDAHKNTIIDIGIVNNIPIFNYEGTGVLFDFLNDMEKDTKLEFNEISYDYGKKSGKEYSFDLTKEVKDNDILIYEDNYAIVSKSNVFIRDFKQFDKMTLGVVKEDLEDVNFYLYDNKNITYKTFNTTKELFDEINSKNSSVNAIAIPKTVNFNNIITNKLNINYDISDYKVNLVLRLGKTKKLNTIIKKYLNKWKSEKYQKSYNKYFSDNYFKLNEVYEDSIANFRRKQYKYGYISYAPYTTLNNSRLVGISSEYMKNFATLSNVEIEYKPYKSIHDLIKDFNENKIDFFLNLSSENKYSMDVYETRNIGDGSIAIVSKEKNNIVINSLSSLKGKDVTVVAESKVANYLKDYGVKTLEVNNFDSIIKELNSDSIIAIETKAFELYKQNQLNDYKVFYEFKIDNNYNYVIRDIEDNKLFEQFFDFYISFENGKKLNNNVTRDMYAKNIKNNLSKYLIITLTAVILDE